MPLDIPPHLVPGNQSEPARIERCRQFLLQTIAATEDGVTVMTPVDATVGAELQASLDHLRLAQEALNKIIGG